MEHPRRRREAELGRRGVAGGQCHVRPRLVQGGVPRGQLHHHVGQVFGLAQVTGRQFRFMRARGRDGGRNGEGDAALGVLEEAESAVRGPLETCPGCRITFAIPATIASARAHEPELASGHLRQSEYLANVVMKLPAWHAALHEARAHVALAAGDAAAAQLGFAAAARVFHDAGHPLDEARCRGTGVRGA